jgi:hypothetical protein
MRLRVCILTATVLGAVGSLLIAADMYRRIAASEALAGGARAPMAFSMFHVLGTAGMAVVFLAILLLLLADKRSAPEAAVQAAAFPDEISSASTAAEAAPVATELPPMVDAMLSPAAVATPSESETPAEPHTPPAADPPPAPRSSRRFSPAPAPVTPQFGTPISTTWRTADSPPRGTASVGPLPIPRVPATPPPPPPPKASQHPGSDALIPATIGAANSPAMMPPAPPTPPVPTPTVLAPTAASVARSTPPSGSAIPLPPPPPSSKSFRPAKNL